MSKDRWTSRCQGTHKIFVTNSSRKMRVLDYDQKPSGICFIQELQAMNLPFMRKINWKYFHHVQKGMPRQVFLNLSRIGIWGQIILRCERLLCITGCCGKQNSKDDLEDNKNRQQKCLPSMVNEGLCKERGSDFALFEYSFGFCLL